MAIISSGFATDQMTVGSTSKAAYIKVTDSRGNDQSMLPSYSACTNLKTATAAGTGSFLIITGTNQRKITIQRIIVCGVVATTAVYGDMVVTKRTFPSVGGTYTTLTPVLKDTTSPQPQASIRYYTVLPTTAAQGGGVVATQMVFMPITATPATIVQPVIFDFTIKSMNEPVILEGSNETLEVSYGTTTTGAPTLTIQVEWTES